MDSQRVFIAGAGRQSVAAGFDLVRFLPGVQLTLSDFDLSQATRAAERIRSLWPEATVSAEQGDVANPESLAESIRGHDAVLAGVPYHLNPQVHLAARMAGVPSVDMGSDLPDLERVLGPREGPHGSTAVFDSGLAPGLGNQIARMLIEEIEAPESVKILCGGLPLNPRTPLRYKPRFSLEGLVGEYSDPAVALKDGEVVEVDSLSELETVEVPGLGTMEAFITSGGASIGPQLHRGQVRNYEYKTLRFPGHCAAMRGYRDLGLWEPSEIEHFYRLFEAATADEDPEDQVVLVVEAKGRTSSRVVIRHAFDPKTGLAAMEQLTGFCASIVVQAVLSGKGGPGLFAAEELVSGREMLAELARRGIAPVD